LPGTETKLKRVDNPLTTCGLGEPLEGLLQTFHFEYSSVRRCSARRSRHGPGADRTSPWSDVESDAHKAPISGEDDYNFVCPCSPLWTGPCNRPVPQL